MSFYSYRQNNSGGSFYYSEVSGISVNVIIEADEVNDANNRARSIGLYFGGIGDCECCGDRWYEVYGTDAEELPSLYGMPVENYDSPRNKWIKNGYETFVHYKDGRIVGYHK